MSCTAADSRAAPQAGLSPSPVGRGAGSPGRAAAYHGLEESSIMQDHQEDGVLEDSIFDFCLAKEVLKRNRVMEKYKSRLEQALHSQSEQRKAPRTSSSCALNATLISPVEAQRKPQSPVPECLSATGTLTQILGSVSQPHWVIACCMQLGAKSKETTPGDALKI
ncbi:hypothetical protein NDU88_003113 [Pleurodeles waltl]|uniref:Uncharacterized protein n=1 Tax=Pleurodeles waltl TaxID=8319 RepID=A0AAV7SEM0_PLEWA|nr:hypothetical protein NDU88_003113 [Pleurodeles waltl]